MPSLAVLKRRRLDDKESEAEAEKRRHGYYLSDDGWNDPDYDDLSDPDPDDGWIESELDRQHWEAQELAREAHDLGSPRGSLTSPVGAKYAFRLS